MENKYRFDGHTVSVIKHAPDGFDIDVPGKASLARPRQRGPRIDVSTSPEGAPTNLRTMPVESR
jgi:molybdopterin-guanine dinucleotide biosynthesis protein